MYSLTGRLNAIAFNTLIILTILSALNYLEAFINKQPPKITKQFEITNIETFVADRYIGEDAMSFTFDFEADLRDVFNWNTNLIFAYITCEYNTTASTFNKVTIWDQRILRTDTEHHIIKLKNQWPEYYLTDVNKQMRGVGVKVYLNWEQMPTVGVDFGGRLEIGNFVVPKNYISGSRR